MSLRKPPSYLKNVTADGIARARTKVNGQYRGLGLYGTPESLARYERVVCEWRASHERGKPLTAGAFTVADLVAEFLDHARGYYLHPDGTPTSELSGFRYSLAPLVKLYGPTPAADFGPLKLKAVREEMVRLGWVRKSVNQHVGRIKRAYKWACSEQLVPAEVFHALGTVAGLMKGRTKATESPDVEPVDPAIVRQTITVLRRPVKQMVEVQLLAGMRPGEVCSMRACEIDREGIEVEAADGSRVRIWVYRPEQHKTAWRGHRKAVPLGPRVQEILAPFLIGCEPGWCVFRPNQVRRDKGARYKVCAYDRRVREVCLRHGIPPWSPGQLRHTAATVVEEQYDLDTARAFLVHKNAQTTKIYAAADLVKAAQVAAKIG